MEIKTPVRIINFADELLSARGIIRAEEIRQESIESVVDSGATMLVLPQDIADKLGLVLLRKVKVRYADGRIEEKDIVGGARVEILGRSAVTDALIEKAGTRPLLGHVVMELLDLIIDPRQGVIKPREESPEMPLIEQL